MFESFLSSFAIAFIPILVAMDAIGVLPIYISLIEKLNQQQRKVVLLEAVITVAVLGSLFTLMGRKIFNFLGITVADFMVAGGVILLILAISDLLFPSKARQQASGSSVGVVPLGIPLIMGPATLTTLIVQSDIVGTPATLAAFFINLALTYGTFLMALPILRVLKKSGTQAVSKVANLMLAAIAVMIIRKGITQIIANFG